LTAVAIAFILGFCFGATDFHESFKGVSWTNILSSITTLSGFLLAFASYNQWLSNKKRDDAYLVAKDYLGSLNEIMEILREINFQYFHLCPSPGLSVELNEISQKRIEHVHNLSHSLYLARVRLNQAKSELVFWKVRLSDTFDEKHNSFNKDLTNINVVMTGLNSQLYHHYFKDNENLDEVLRHKDMYDQYMNAVTTILDERVLLGFEKVFIFE